MVEDRTQMMRVAEKEHYYVGIEISGDSYKVDPKTNFLKKNLKKEIMEETGQHFEHIQLNYTNMLSVEKRFAKLVQYFNSLEVEYV